MPKYKRIPFILIARFQDFTRVLAHCRMHIDPRRIHLGEGTLLFARNFLMRPKMVGSLFPSSRFVVERILEKINWHRAMTIVEYGPGVGTITEKILARMSPAAKLIALETNKDFVCYLERAFLDRRLDIVHTSADSVLRILQELGIRGVDYIISGVPYTNVSSDQRRTMIEQSCKALNPGGAMLIYQYRGVLLPLLRTCFGKVQQDFELRNILPIRIFSCSLRHD
jgi:phospholipid N-methyltransferase